MYGNKEKLPKKVVVPSVLLAGPIAIVLLGLIFDYFGLAVIKASDLSVWELLGLVVFSISVALTVLTILLKFFSLFFKEKVKFKL